MRILYVPANGNSKVMNIDNKLETMQVIVGGYIECVQATRVFPVELVPDIISQSDYEEICSAVIVCDEEGLLKRKNANAYGIVGDFFVVNTDLTGECDEFLDVTDRQIGLFKRFLNLWGKI